ncbi:hypothetical protein Vafri_1905 [Volvox africanus]|nr:hypothetical protein Vafri_1905 [Volvox africanus]
MSTPGNGTRTPAATTTATSTFKPRDRKYGQRQPIWLKRDKFARHGEALLLAALPDDPLERCLAVVRFVLAILSDMLRPGGPDPDDLPITSLGHHHVTVRQLSIPGLGPVRAAAMSPAARAPNGGGGAILSGGTTGSGGGGGGGGPSLPCVHVQELLSFDPKEGPKQLHLAPGGVGPFAAVAALKIEPRIKVKAKRLGRDLSIKVRLEGGGHVVLFLPGFTAPLEPQLVIREAASSAVSPLELVTAAAASSPIQAPNIDGAVAAAAPPQERYIIVFPNLVLRGSLPYAARPELHGDLIIQCPAAGLMASLTFKENGVVKGVLEKLQPQAQRRQRVASGGSILSAGGAAGGTAAAAVIGNASTSLSGKMSSMYGVIGSFMGSLYDSIHVTCPELGLEGTLHSEQPPMPGLPPLTQLMDLSRPGPQQLPRLWTAVHDSLIYNDPKQVRQTDSFHSKCSETGIICDIPVWYI